MKKIIWIIVIVLIVAGVYWFFFAGNSSQNGNGGKSSLRSLFPFGLSNNTTTGTVSTSTDQGSNTDNGNTASAPYDPLQQLSTRGVVGMTIVLPNYSVLQAAASSTSKTATTTVAPSTNNNLSIMKSDAPVIRFAERGTGYIYDVDAHGKNETKRTGTTIVRVAEAYFGDNGNSVIFRYLKNDNSTIETYLGRIVASIDSTQFATVKGSFLPENISNLVMSPDGTSLAYLLGTKEGTGGISIKTDGSNKKQLFSSSFDEWLLDWKQGGLFATTKASGDISGYAYLVQDSGAFQKMIGEVNGLTTNVSPNGKLMLYDTSGKGKLNLFIRRQNGDSTKLDIKTLPEKCVWNRNSTAIYCAVPIAVSDPSVNYPDDWYLGLTHFNDTIWRVDAGTGNATQISDLEGKSIDATNLLIDQNDTFLFFINKNDGTPWSYDIRPAQEQAVVPALSPFPAVTNQKAQ